MANPRPLEPQVLNSGEPRHYAGWKFDGIPKLDRTVMPSAEALHRRQKIYAPRYHTRGLTQILNALRFR